MSVRSASVGVRRDAMPAMLEESTGAPGGESAGQGAVVSGFRNAAGLSLLALGAVGLVLPIVPGVPLLVAAVAILGRDHPVVRSGTRWIGGSRELAARLGRRLSWRGAPDRVDSGG